MLPRQRRSSLEAILSGEKVSCESTIEFILTGKQSYSEWMKDNNCRLEIVPRKKIEQQNAEKKVAASVKSDKENKEKNEMLNNNNNTFNIKTVIKSKAETSIMIVNQQQSTSTAQLCLQCVANYASKGVKNHKKYLKLLALAAKEAARKFKKSNSKKACTVYNNVIVNDNTINIGFTINKDGLIIVDKDDNNSNVQAQEKQEEERQQAIISNNDLTRVDQIIQQIEAESSDDEEADDYGPLENYKSINVLKFENLLEARKRLSILLAHLMIVNFLRYPIRIASILAKRQYQFGNDDKDLLKVFNVGLHFYEVVYSTFAGTLNETDIQLFSTMMINFGLEPKLQTQREQYLFSTLLAHYGTKNTDLLYPVFKDLFCTDSKKLGYLLFNQILGSNHTKLYYELNHYIDGQEIKLSEA